MCVLAERPDVSVGDWVVVSGVDCVISNVYSPEYKLAVCEVVCTPQKPANRDVTWTGTAWAFYNENDFGGYADRYPRLAPFVAKLTRGRWMM